MIELNGKHNTAKVFTDNIDDATIGQVIELLNQDFVKNSNIRIMPDCLTEDVEILTDGGFKKIMDLSTTDKICKFYLALP